jgi:hypothetical protein
MLKTHLFRSDFPPNWAPGQPLPDGVTMKPLDEATLNLLNGHNIQPKHEEKHEKPQALEAHRQKYPSKDFYVNTLQELIQDERNSALFYTYLAGIAPTREYAEYLKHVSIQCAAQKDRLCDLHAKHTSQTFKPIESKINNSIKFIAGINWAVEIESAEIDKLCELYEIITDQEFSKALFTFICNKIILILRLSLILSRM